MRTSLVTILACYGATLGSMVAQTNSIPFPWNWSQAHRSQVNLSRFLDAPAGKGGYVRVQNGRFIKPDGARLRLWGVNIASSSCFPPKDQAPLIADDLARLGFNIARFHHLDADWGRCIFISKTNHTRAFDFENLDRLDFFVAELKKRGIYTSLTMNVHRKFKHGDDVRDHQLLGIGKGATYFNPRLLELQHEFTRNLLQHKSPYTGNEYRHEPAVVSIEMVNENSLLEAWCQWRLVGRDDKSGDTWSPIPVSYANELTSQYNAWLRTNRSEAQIAVLRAEAKIAEGELLPRLTPAEFTNASPLRFYTEARFLMSVESNYFFGMKRLIRDELGSKSLLFGSADHNDGFAGYTHLLGMTQFDFLDGHGYWEHPEIGQVTKIKNTPMVNDPLDSTFNQFARTPMGGMPFTISEVNHPFPHKYAAEGYLILTAYALLQDWDGIVWFDWENGRMGDPKEGIRRNGWFDVSQDPVKLAHLTMAGLLWHRADVARAKEEVTRTYSPSEMVEAMRLVSWKHRPFFKDGFDLSTPLKHRVRWSLDEQDAGQGKTAPRPADRTIPVEISSDTGELRWSGAHKKAGIVEIKTPRVEAMVGFTGGAQREGAHFSVSITNNFSVIALSSLDDRPIATSDRLLLVATPGAVENTGQKFAADGKTLETWGSGPVLLEPIQGTVNLTGLTKASRILVTPLTPEGRPASESTSAQSRQGAWSITLGTPPTTWWLIQVSR